jgi:uncharacterized protein YukJ
MKSIRVRIFLCLMVVLAVLLKRATAPSPGPDRPLNEQMQMEWCDTDPQVLKWDENWDPNNKILVGQFGSKQGLHDYHVEQCIESRLPRS